MGTAIEVRRGFDLSRSPDEQWNAEMVQLVTRQLFRGMDVSVNAVRYCLAIAEGLDLNPLIGEVYFIPGKSKDAKGPSLQPYIGRNGLVKRADERGYYFESDTVHKLDKFRVTRRRNGDVEVTHSYDPTADRGDVAGAYAFLHRRDGSEKPAFFFAELSQYMPTYDAAWKLAASPWGNQLSAMIEKCAMIGSGRKRLKLGNVLIDGEIPIYEEMGSVGPRPTSAPADVSEYPFEELTDDPALAERLRSAVLRERWAAAKIDLAMRGRTHAELVAMLAGLENQAATHATPSPATPPVAETQAGGGEPDPGGSGAEDGSGADIQDAEVVAPVPLDHEKVRALEKRKAALEDDLNDPTLSEQDHADLAAELENVEREIAAAIDPGQPNLFG